MLRRNFTKTIHELGVLRMPKDDGMGVLEILEVTSVEEVEGVGFAARTVESASVPEVSVGC